jgi:hypothetical protein
VRNRLAERYEEYSLRYEAVAEAAAFPTQADQIDSWTFVVEVCIFQNRRAELEL